MQHCVCVFFVFYSDGDRVSTVAPDKARCIGTAKVENISRARSVQIITVCIV